MYMVRIFAYFRKFSTVTCAYCSICDFLEFGDVERDIAEHFLAVPMYFRIEVMWES